MSKKRGLSLEDKRAKLLELFYEKKEFYQLKELEKIAPKEKGITSQSVKDVLQSLVDDNLVDTEKIGTSIYFWAFPSKAAISRKRKLDSLESQMQETLAKKTATAAKIKSVKKGREDTEEREELSKRLDELKAENKDLLAKLEIYRSCDPEVVKEMAQQIKLFVESVNRWTDNIFSIKSWCKNKFSIEENVLNKHFGIAEDLDYVS